MAHFELNLEDNIFQLHERLSAGTWESDPYTAFFVQDPKLRRIHKASVRDRVLHQAVYRALYQIFDRSFIHDSYSSRDRKGTHRGVRRFEEFARKVTVNYSRGGFALKCDIRKFFDSIDHEILIALLKNKIHDDKLLDLVVKIIRSFSVLPGKGLPLGNVTSQIMANIYMNELDQFMKHDLKTKYYIRYCDDFVILHDSGEYLEENIGKMMVFLARRLKLDLHPNKIFLRKIRQGVDFLGYVSLPGYMILRTRTKHRMVKKMAMAHTRYKSGTISLDEFKQIMDSYAGMLSHCKSEKIKRLIRERIFMLYSSHVPATNFTSTHSLWSHYSG